MSTWRIVRSKEEARSHIESLARQRLEGSDDLKDSLSGALHRIMMMFPQVGHFLMEFLQNADDARSSRFLVELVPDGVRIANNGCPFEPWDVESICRVGRSAKRVTDYIGYLGMGFKSVFLLSDTPRVYSGYYSFTFDRNHWPESTRVPWQITPIWYDKTPEWTHSLHASEGYTTFFELPLRPDGQREVIERVRGEFEPENFSPRVLLFLRNVMQVQLRDQVQGSEWVIEKTRLKPSAQLGATHEFYRLSETRAGGKTTVENWVVFRSVVPVPEEVRADWKTRQWDRQKVTQREIAVAFAIDESGQLQRVTGTAHMGVFSFLPLKEVPSGLPFLVQADFLTGPGRESIRRDALWNAWLAEELYRFITQKVVPALIAHQDWRYVVAELLYPGQGGPEPINERLTAPLRKYAREQPILVAADGSLATADQAVTITAWESGWFQHVGPSAVEALMEGQKVLHQRTRLPWELRVTEGPWVNSKHWPWSMDRLVDAMAQKCDTTFFHALYRDLGRYSERTIRGAPWSAAALVLTGEGTRVQATAAYWSEEGPEKLGSLHRVHPDIWADSDSRQFLQILGVQVLSPSQVKERLMIAELVERKELWPSLSDDERIALTGRLFQAWREGAIRPDVLDFLTVRTLDGRWAPPGQVFFSNAYDPPGHRLEVLIGCGLLQGIQEEIPLLAPDYLRLGSGSTYEWRRFFEELRVDRRLVDEGLKRDLVERVAQEVLVRYEEARVGRRPAPMPHAQETGYDFQSGERRIELKGRSGSEPTIDLTRAQFRELGKDDYYIYVVADALRNPALYVLPGRRLTELVPDVTFAHFQWRDLADDRYFALEVGDKSKDVGAR